MKILRGKGNCYCSFLFCRLLFKQQKISHIVHFKASLVVLPTPPFLNIYYLNQTKKDLWTIS